MKTLLIAGAALAALTAPALAQEVPPGNTPGTTVGAPTTTTDPSATTTSSPDMAPPGTATGTTGDAGMSSDAMANSTDASSMDHGKHKKKDKRPR